MLLVRARSNKRGPGQPRRLGPDPAPPVPAEIAPSLPPAHPEPPVASPSDTEEVPKHVALIRQPNKRERMGMQVIAMRIAGMSEQEIADTVGLSKETIPSYVYLANKGGWLDLPTAKEAVNYSLLPKALKRLHEAMESGNVLVNGMPERTHVAIKVAEGTIFKEYDRVVDPGQGSQVVAIRIEMPEGPRPMMRDETTGGTPAFVDAEIVK